MGQLAEAYRRHFGGAQSSLQLYGGFAAFFAGAALGLGGILMVVGGEILITEDWERNQVGILLAALGFPFVFMGLQMTLPSRWVIHGVAGLGAAVCIVAAFMFLQAWPQQWSERYPRVIGLYTLGLVVLFTTVALAVIFNYLSRHMVLPGQELADDLFNDPDRPVSMEEVMRDIEREVGRQKLTWGGVEGDRLPREFLKLKADFGPDASVSHGRAGKVTETLADEMDIAFTSLARLRGVEGKEVSDEDDTAVAIGALRALREARQAELERSWWYRFKRWLISLFIGNQPAADQGKQAPPAHSQKDHIRHGKKNRSPRPENQQAVVPGQQESGSRSTQRKDPEIRAR